MIKATGSTAAGTVDIIICAAMIVLMFGIFFAVSS